MLPEKIMQSDLLDILFENRNKNYGAYTLRKFYYQRLNIAIATTIFLSACLCLIMLFHPGKKKDYIKTIIFSPDAQLTQVPDKPIIPPSSRTQPVSHLKQVINSTPEIVPDDWAKLPPTTDQVDKAAIGSFAFDGKDNIDIIQPPAETQHGNGINTVQPAEKVEDKPLISAEVMPEFPGGVNALVKFIQKNAHQPNDLQAGEAIKVIASFVVSKTGNIENVKIVNTGRADLAKEVLRVINKMPLWKPGMQNGKPVSVYFNLPVTFQSADE